MGASLPRQRELPRPSQHEPAALVRVLLDQAERERPIDGRRAAAGLEAERAHDSGPTHEAAALALAEVADRALHERERGALGACRPPIGGACWLAMSRYRLRIVNHEGRGRRAVFRFYGYDTFGAPAIQSKSLELLAGADESPELELALDRVDRIEVVPADILLEVDAFHVEPPAPAPAAVSRADALQTARFQQQHATPRPAAAPARSPADGRCAAERGFPGGELVRCRLKDAHDEPHDFARKAGK
jgi:hypothetical protein